MILSVCIPTYNRAVLLKETLVCLLSVIPKSEAGKVEIVISDNGSTDHTEAIVNELIKTSPIAINYFKIQENVGYDRNCMQVMQCSSGQYCWLLGDDDLPTPNSIVTLLDEIRKNENVDVYLGNKEDFYCVPSQSMKSKKILDLSETKIFNFTGPQAIIDYLQMNRYLIGLFNFISILVIRREAWMAVKNYEKHLESKYIHIYMVMSILWGRKGRLKYLPAVLVKRRWGNDLTAGMSERLHHDVNTYYGFSQEILKDPKIVRYVNKLSIKNDVFSWAVRARVQDINKFYFVDFPFLFSHYWSLPIFWFKIFPLLFVPGTVLKIARGLYRIIIKRETIGLREACSC
ncbi:MAG: glycosyltransferase [Candidatus Margulisiibacteriota bacterium]